MLKLPVFYGMRPH